jgi:hypothetical protein
VADIIYNGNDHALIMAPSTLELLNVGNDFPSQMKGV